MLANVGGGFGGDVATLGFISLGVLALGRKQWQRRPLRPPRPKVPRRGAIPPTPAAASELPRSLPLTSILGVLGVLDTYDALAGALPVTLVRSGPDDLEFVLSAPIDRAPTWCTRMNGGKSILVTMSVIEPLVRQIPPSPGPLILPLGHESRGWWAAIVNPGASIALLGSQASELFAELDNVARHSPAPDRIRLVTADGTVRVEWSEVNGLRAATVTSLATEETDMVIVSDRRGLTVHPYGLVLRKELPPPCPTLEPSSRPSDPSSSPRLSGAGLTPGDLEVRLLTVVPRLDGLRSALPANRARRAIELIAYLAIHHPDPISSDRLRTRVLGSPETDAAAKTLFNTVGAARKALGLGPDGQPYLPNASRHGHYTLSALVTVDVVRAAQMFRLAKAAESPDESLALYRAAFALSEGEPFAGSLAGYAWWRSEGHEARFNALSVEAAGRAVRLAIEQGLLDLASWILDQARLVESFSEVLSRAAMAIAAASGDQAWLRREWDDCRRRVRELDPNGSLSVETENLFRRLSRP